MQTEKAIRYRPAEALLVTTDQQREVM